MWKIPFSRRGSDPPQKKIHLTQLYVGGRLGFASFIERMHHYVVIFLTEYGRCYLSIFIWKVVAIFIFEKKLLLLLSLLCIDCKFQCKLEGDGRSHKFTDSWHIYLTRLELAYQGNAFFSLNDLVWSLANFSLHDLVWSLYLTCIGGLLIK